MSRALCRVVSLYLCFPPSSSRVVVKPESEHLSSIPRACVSAFMPPLQPTLLHLDSRHAELQFWNVAAAVPLRPVAARVVASLHHFTPCQFLCTVSSPWLPLRRAHASRSSCATSSPMTRPCLCGPPFTSPCACGQPHSGHLRPSQLLSKVTGGLSLLTRCPTALIVAMAHLNTIAIVAGCPLSWRGPSMASWLAQPPPIVSC